MKRTEPLHAARPLLRVTPEGELHERTYSLSVLAGPDLGLNRVLTQPLVVGSQPGADLVLKDSTVSRLHVQLSPRAEGVHVRDLQSTNGTFLSGARVHDITIEQEAHLRVGQSVLRISLQEKTLDVPSGPGRLGAAVSEVPVMRRLFGVLERVAQSDSSVLLLGETGVGKEVLARAVHTASARQNHPFVVVDCGALAPSLIESELFGHVKGAFTGAVGARPGAFLEASQGTLFLDEIGELPLDLQPKLLRALDSGTVKPVGHDASRDVDVRIVAATHRDLEAEVSAGRFRQDLYFRLAVVPVKVPPLRERLSDLPLLIQHFAAQLNSGAVDVSSEVLALFQGYAWPGNVRELRNVVERALAGAGLEAPRSSARKTEETTTVNLRLPFKEAKRQLMDSFVRSYLESLTERCGGNLSRMSRSAGIARHYLRELMQKHELGETEQE